MTVTRSEGSASGPAPGVPLFDMRRQTAALHNEIAQALDRVCQSGRFIFGPDCRELEDNLASVCHVQHAVGCASGSDALLLALMAIEVGPGDEVLLPSYTFFATASAIWRLGAKPVFVDIEPLTYNLCPRHAASLVTSATKAIIPVHLYGQCADMEPLVELARRHSLALIEDAAQAIGAQYADRPAGSWGDIGCFSFYPTKNLGGFGDGGLLTTNDALLAARLRLLRGHGMEPRYYHHVVGINSRLDSLQAAVLNVKLPHLERWTNDRDINAHRYARLMRDRGLECYLELPQVAPQRRHVWNQYVVRVAEGKRDALRTHLEANRIGTEIYYPLPLHLQPCFSSLGYKAGMLPETERAAKETLALPIFPELTADEQEQVVEAIGTFYGAKAATTHGLKRPKFLDRTQRSASSEEHGR
ncbi:MAG: DegT/DnrJ/EryC1/StrS family aminotransferase [Pirellulales bacterium]|nr:DegT/DnrJ/EryC1/StrS family aminotransferase [Pirellulales bacterium]